jgi:hypothetical protein
MGIGAITSSSIAPQAGALARNPARAETAQQELSPDDQARIDQLKARDLEVRQHEQAHLAAAGGLATSGASYTYQRGPNGVNYAVGGEVNIDTSPGRTPEETLDKARRIQAAALAPAEPSSAAASPGRNFSQTTGAPARLWSYRTANDNRYLCLIKSSFCPESGRCS